ncbi:papilin isoform X8 [Patella vulgata]|uniref:papilin isoform X8 n=1 Tax=Patella vulgata TaxID=6465 RepID=UPI0024A935E1|nr:papilin isoform X8 [Patella vulgata]
MRGEMGYLWFVGCFILVTIETQVQGREKGRWEEWGKYSPCSRSCGGGVQQRVRRCIRGRSHMNGLCAGPGVEYSSCNTQQCSAGSHDFRAAQCSRYNKVKVNGLNKLHTWKPYTDENDKCVLKCQSLEDSNIIKEFAQRVVDGTNCDNVDSFGICVAGVCQAVGCDRVIGSFMKEDKCRVCGGDGTTCQTIAAIFDSQNLKVGLNKIVTIPAGSTSIVVREITNSNSFLVVKNGVGNYYINSWRKITEDNSATDIAGTTIRYIKSPQNPDEPETLTALGPTNETLHIELMLRDSNPGIQYEYSLQKSLVHEAENPRLRYIWINGVWTRCSKSCGKGLQIRAVSCIDRQSGVAISNDLCDIRLKPDGRRVCTQQDCPEDRIGYSWVLGHWGECSSDCGIGEQTQLAYCQEKGTMGKAIYTDDQLCIRYVGPKPVLKRVCQGDISCPHWAMGPWQECSVTCGYGVQTRYISCQEEPSDDDEVPRMRSEEMCAHEKRPQRQQLCTLSPCSDGSNGEYLEFKDVEEVDVDCSVTLYGCCDDGKTRADNWNKDNCPNSRERCSLEKSRGKCGNFTLFYYFDTKSISCSPFWYGGCGGNDNRFATIDECKEACRHTETVLKANRAASLINSSYANSSQTPDPNSQAQNRTEKTGSESQTTRQELYPHNITLAMGRDNRQSVVLSWQAPAVSDGNITGYVIYYSTKSQTDMGSWSVEAVVGTRLSTIISDLQPDTTYYFRLQARNRYSYGPMTDIITYRTPSGKKLNKDFARSCRSVVMPYVVKLICSISLFVIKLD